MAKHFADVADIELLEIKDLPAFNEPEDKIAPAVVAVFAQKIASVDGGYHRYTRTQSYHSIKPK